MKYFIEEKEISQEQAIGLLGLKWFKNYMRVAIGMFNCGFKTYKLQIQNNQTLTITR